jgi:hypothetical protein
MGEIKKAKHHFEMCLRFVPKHKRAWENLRSLTGGTQQEESCDGR